MTKKAPRRTAQRIQDCALTLFNRFGEPNVSTTRIAAEMGISPGNLYYHYPAKDVLINRLHQDCEAELTLALQQGQHAQDLPAAAELVRSLLALVWRYRFLFRDLNDLLSKSREVEQRLQAMLHRQETALQQLLGRLTARKLLTLSPNEIDMLARSMGVLLSSWLTYEYAEDPRGALEPPQASQTLARGCAHILQLLSPHIAPAERATWQHQIQPGARQQPPPDTAQRSHPPPTSLLSSASRRHPESARYDPTGPEHRPDAAAAV